ncbi:MAG: cupin domain-containing protein [Planctomycetes bacterium]|nr:cupin domain-containing protein [Planctomycetota bacterium]
MNDFVENECSHRDDAIVFVLGEFDHESAASYDRHQRECSSCRRLVKKLSILYDEVVRRLEVRSVPDSVRSWVLARARRTTGNSPLLAKVASSARRSVDEYFIAPRVPEESTAWETTAIVGIRMRRLLVDEREGRMTCLVQMDPGARFPAHVHAGREECFVLEGDLCTTVSEMRSGDYEHAPAGTRHEEQFTRNGCLLLIRTSLYDEFAA